MNSITRLDGLLTESPHVTPTGFCERGIAYLAATERRLPAGFRFVWYNLTAIPMLVLLNVYLKRPTKGRKRITPSAAAFDEADRS
jgi:hypothetical protein